MAILTRRSLLGGLFAAPAVVKAASLMPVKLWVDDPFSELVINITVKEPFFADSETFWAEAVAWYLRDYAALRFDDGV
jgi:hypothetical protein